jgi:hypothetical protein
VHVMRWPFDASWGSGRGMDHGDDVVLVSFWLVGDLAESECTNWVAAGGDGLELARWRR